MDPDIAFSVLQRIKADPAAVAKALLLTAAIADLTGHRAERDDALEIAADLLAMSPPHGRGSSAAS